jgi:hypothetical protein
MRWRLAAGLALGLALAHACSDEGFECDADEQCTLAGEPGQCVEGGRCAYPNPQCPSGLAYPQGAPEGLAGECVPGDALGSGTGDEGSSSSEPGADVGTSGDGEALDDATADSSTGTARCVTCP